MGKFGFTLGGNKRNCYPLTCKDYAGRDYSEVAARILLEFVKGSQLQLFGKLGVRKAEGKL